MATSDTNIQLQDETASLQSEGEEQHNEASRQALTAGKIRETVLNTMAIPKLIDLGRKKEVGKLIIRNMDLMAQIDPERAYCGWGGDTRPNEPG